MNNTEDVKDREYAERRLLHSRFIRGLLIAAGTFSLGLGIVGIFLPLVPTTPLLLLTAACYARSSPRFYQWLMHNRWFGRTIRDYREGRGIPPKVKIVSVSFLWITILVSCCFFVNNLYLNILLLLIASAVTIHIVKIGHRKRG